MATPQPQRLKPTGTRVQAEIVIRCHECKRRLGTYYGEPFALIPVNSPFVPKLYVYCSQCDEKLTENEAKEEETKLG